MPLSLLEYLKTALIIAKMQGNMNLTTLRRLATVITALTLSAITALAELPQYKEITTGKIPSATSGEIRRYSVESHQLGAAVTVDVWTPDGYSSAAYPRYPVIYAHDGQNLFDPALSFAGVAWEIDSKTQGLIDRGEITPPIVVGISNRGDKGLRPNDYFPEKVLDYIPATDRDKTKIFDTCKGGFYGDEEATFVATELKPLIDRLYLTNPAPSHTFAIGSSMGGLASLYLMCEYPDVFGGAACLSTHWIGSLDLDPDYNMSDDPVCAKAILAYMNACLPSPATHRLYLDQGTEGWDAAYLPYEATARQIALDHRYSVADGSLMTHDETGAGHNEWFWQQRITLPLEFLLDPHRLPASITSISNPLYSDNLYIGLTGLIHHDDSTRLPSGIYIHPRSGTKILIP